MVPDRLEVVIEGPVRQAFAKVPRGNIGEAEMDPQPYSCVDNIGA